MPFEGPEGQGPFASFSECVSAMEDEEGVDDPEALCGYWKELDENQANAMTEPNDDEVQYRQYYRASPDDISVREVDENEEGLFAIRMPIASTGEVRNEGDDPLSREEIDGMARQINDGDVGVFLAHGDSPEITAARYGQTERLGNWREAEVETREERDDDADADLLFASAEMMDPDTLPNIGPIRNALGTLKEQAKRNIGISSSIGWRDAEDAPGGNDLMEASIVGIPADPRTVTQGGPAVAVARAAVDAGADPDALVDAFRSAVTGDRDPADVFRDLTEQQSDMALELLDQFVEEQGDASVRNFDQWLWEIDDEDADDNAIHAARTALEEFFRANSPMDEAVSDTFRSWLESQPDGDMSDDENESDAENQAADTDDDSTERQDAPEWASDLRELLESMNETLGDVAEAVRQDDDDDDEDDDEDQADDDDDDEEDDRDADVTADQREALETLRDGGFNVDDLDLPEPDTDEEQDAEESATRDTDPDEEPTKAILR